MVWIPRLAAAFRFGPRSSRKMDSEGCRPSLSKHSLYILGSGLQTPSRQDSTTWGRGRKERWTSLKVVFFLKRRPEGQWRFVITSNLRCHNIKWCCFFKWSDLDILIRKLETLIAVLPILTVVGKLSETGRCSKMTQHSAHVRYCGCMEQKKSCTFQF